MTRKQGTMDLFDDIPLTLADDPEIELGDLDVLPAVERQTLHPVCVCGDYSRQCPRVGHVNRPVNPEAVRTMFEGFGWAVTR